MKKGPSSSLLNNRLKARGYERHCTYYTSESDGEGSRKKVMNGGSGSMNERWRKEKREDEGSEEVRRNRERLVVSASINSLSVLVLFHQQTSLATLSKRLSAARNSKKKEEQTTKEKKSRSMCGGMLAKVAPSINPFFVVFCLYRARRRRRTGHTIACAFYPGSSSSSSVPNGELFILVGKQCHKIRFSLRMKGAVQ